MMLTPIEMLVIAAAVTAILMAGSTHLRINLAFYSIETLLIGLATALLSQSHAEQNMLWIALAIASIKGIAIPLFLNWTIDKIEIHTDAGTLIAAPLAMHLSIVLLAASYMFVSGLPVPIGDERGWPGATAAISLVLTGLVLMLTRRVAISQIVGFLVIENGIYLFALTQTRGMPMIVEMGVLLDVLVGVMIAGLLVFNIQRSFEHIDVTQLTELKD